MDRVVVRVRTLPVPLELVPLDYANNAEARTAYARWAGELWQAKDALIAQTLEAGRTQGRMP
jgi:hypothetical protein